MEILGTKSGIAVSGGAWILLAATLVFVPLKWVCGVLTAAFVHELCHWAALTALRIPVRRIQVRCGGTQMVTGAMSAGEECLASFAGPVGSLLLLTLGRWFPRLAVCAGIQGCFNLLPVYPLDGGRILRRGLEKIPEAPWKIYLEPAISGTCLLLAGVWVSRRFPGITGALLVVSGLARWIPGKRPCKTRPNWVQ